MTVIPALLRGAGAVLAEDDAGWAVCELGDKLRALLMEMDLNQLREFASRYTDSWCSLSALNVAAFFEPDGALIINAGPAAVGRAAIAEVVLGFMTDFPDLELMMDDLGVEDDRVIYHWTLRGRYRGSGTAVRISGFESWKMGAEGLIAESRGYFDEAAYQRQIQFGLGESD